MTALRVNFVAALLLSSGCATVQVAELLPRGGEYNWGSLDGDPPQRMLVVSDKAGAVLVHLKQGSQSSLSCSRVSSEGSCAEVLAGRHLATVFVLKSDGIHELEQAEVVVPIEPKVGTTWQIGPPVDGCRMMRSVADVKSDSVQIDMAMRCDGSADEPVMKEFWRTGAGRAEVRFKAGGSTFLTPVKDVTTR